eukprot:SAG31_NODE_3629_length_4049_cov_3.487089_4_plen_60_part_01
MGGCLPCRTVYEIQFKHVPKYPVSGKSAWYFSYSRNYTIAFWSTVEINTIDGIVSSCLDY